MSGDLKTLCCSTVIVVLIWVALMLVPTLIVINLKPLNTTNPKIITTKTFSSPKSINFSVEILYPIKTESSDVNISDIINFSPVYTTVEILHSVKNKNSENISEIIYFSPAYTSVEILHPVKNKSADDNISETIYFIPVN